MSDGHLTPPVAAANPIRVKATVGSAVGTNANCFLIVSERQILLERPKAIVRLHGAQRCLLDTRGTLTIYRVVRRGPIAFSYILVTDANGFSVVTVTGKRVAELERTASDSGFHVEIVDVPKLQCAVPVSFVRYLRGRGAIDEDATAI